MLVATAVCLGCKVLPAAVRSDFFQSHLLVIDCCIKYPTCEVIPLLAVIAELTSGICYIPRKTHGKYDRYRCDSWLCGSRWLATWLRRVVASALESRRISHRSRLRRPSEVGLSVCPLPAACSAVGLSPLLLSLSPHPIPNCPYHLASREGESREGRLKVGKKDMGLARGDMNQTGEGRTS